MEINELLLKTAFACMSCDGDIADEEVELLREMAKDNLFGEIDINSEFARLVQEINQKGKRFLQQYISELADTELTEDEEIKIADVAVKTIRADNIIQYSEIKFFKVIREHLTHVSDKTLLEKVDNIDEQYLAKDIRASYLQIFEDYFSGEELPKFEVKIS
jgi:uncharacterized tellurite resistance protein B-like protein